MLGKTKIQDTTPVRAVPQFSAHKQPEAPDRQRERQPVQLLALPSVDHRAQNDSNRLRAADLLTLQRTVGNRQVQQMLANHVDNAIDEVQTETTEKNSESMVQTKLIVGALTGVCEKVADCVAGQSMTMPDTAQRRSIQREALPGEAKESVPTKAPLFTHGSDVSLEVGTPPGNHDLTAHQLTQGMQQTGMVQAQSIDPALPQSPSAATGSSSPALERVQAAIAANHLQTLIAIQHELRQQMLTDSLHPPAEARVGLATARHWTMDRIAAIRDTYARQIAAASTGGEPDQDNSRTGAVETQESRMDAECTPYLDALMEGDPQYRYEHFNSIVSEKVFAAVRLHSARRGVGRIGHRAEAEAEARTHGRLPTGEWCGAFAYTQAEQGGGFDRRWVGHMQGEGGIRSALGYGGVMAHTWIWVFDHWENLRAYHASRGSVRWYQAIHRTPPPQGIQAGDLVLIDNAFGTNPDHITTAISFDGRFLATVGGNQGPGEAGVSRSSHAFDLHNNPEPNDVRKINAEGQRIREVDPNLGTKHVRVHGIGRWSTVDYERHIYSTSPHIPTAPPSGTQLAALG